MADLVSAFDPERALALYQTALALDAERADTVAGLARLYVARNEPAQAFEQIARGRAMAPARLVWAGLDAYRILAAGRPDDAADALAAPAGVEREPVAALVGVQALAAAGRRLEALAAATRLVDAHPAFCDARAVLGGLLIDDGRPVEGRRSIEPILAAAVAPGAAPARAPCAAAAAAALGDDRAAGEWLRRIAGNEAMLRVWLLNLDGGGHDALARGWYPWPRVASAAEVAGGADALRAASGRLRAQIAPLMPPVGESRPALR
jgi:tetratricopeptide (TPR) repeat protein